MAAWTAGAGSTRLNWYVMGQGTHLARLSRKALPKLRQCRIFSLRTVAETEIFQRYAAEIWRDEEREQFVNWIAANPEAGALVAGSGGCRKVRWATSGQGKRGGARIIYFLHSDQTIWLLIAYKKAKFDNLSTSFIGQLRKAVQDGL